MREQLRIERLKRRMTQWELTKQTGIKPARISLFENGYIDLEDFEIDKIKQALGITEGGQAVEAS